MKYEWRKQEKRDLQRKAGAVSDQDAGAELYYDLREGDPNKEDFLRESEFYILAYQIKNGYKKPVLTVRQTG